MSLSIQKLLVVIVSLGLLGFLGYKIFTYSPIPSGLAEGSVNDVIGEDILSLVEKLKVISIDPAIFSSALFSNLKDSTVPLGLESFGRVNPFAAIGTESENVPVIIIPKTGGQ